MALVPIISQTWDTTSVFTPTRMNNIEQNLAIVSNATGVKYSNGVSVKDKIDELNSKFKVSSITSTPSTGVTNNSAIYRIAENLLIISLDVVFNNTPSSGWNNAFTFNVTGKKVDGFFGSTYNGALVQVYGTGTLTCRLNNVSLANTNYRGEIIVPLEDI